MERSPKPIVPNFDYIVFHFIPVVKNLPLRQKPRGAEYRTESLRTAEYRTKTAYSCAYTGVTDIMFATPPGANRINTNRALTFYQSVISELPLRDENINIGLVPKNCKHIPELNLENNKEPQERKGTIEKWSASLKDRANLEPVLKYLHKFSFNTKHMKFAVHHGKVKDHGRMAVIMVDSFGSKHDVTKSLREAAKLRIMKGVEMFVVAIGKKSLHFFIKLSTLSTMVHVHGVSPRFVHDFTQFTI